MKQLKYRLIGCTGCTKCRYSTSFNESNLETEYTCYQCQGDELAKLNGIQLKYDVRDYGNQEQRNPDS